MKVLLPKSGDQALRRMAGNELIAEENKADCLAAVDIQRDLENAIFLLWSNIWKGKAGCTQMPWNRPDPSWIHFSGA